MKLAIHLAAAPVAAFLFAAPGSLADSHHVSENELMAWDVARPPVSARPRLRTPEVAPQFRCAMEIKLRTRLAERRNLAADERR
jgi:hypothetical protein